MLTECIGATAQGAHIISYGAQSSPDFKTAQVNLPLMALDRRTLTFTELFEVTEDAERFAAAQGYIRKAVRRGALLPVIGSFFPLAEVQAAYRHLESGHLSGKVVSRWRMYHVDRPHRDLGQRCRCGQSVLRGGARTS